MPTPLTGDAGSFTVGGRSWETGGWDGYPWGDVGENAALLTTRQLLSDAGSYTLSGQDAGFNDERYLACSAGSFTVSGQAAGLLRNYLATGAAGAFALSGEVAVQLRGAALSGEPTSYALSGQDATFVYTAISEFAVTGDAGAFTLTVGSGLTNYTVGVDAGAYAWSGAAVTVSKAPRRRVVVVF